MSDSNVTQQTLSNEAYCALHIVRGRWRGEWRGLFGQPCSPALIDETLVHQSYVPAQTLRPETHQLPVEQGSQSKIICSRCRSRTRVEHINRFTGCNCFAEHGHTVTSDHDGMGQAEESQIGIVGIFRAPVMEVKGRLQPFLQGLGERSGRTGTGGDQQRTPERLAQAREQPSKTAGGIAAESIRTAVSSDQDREIGDGQMCESRLPMRCCLRQGSRMHGMRSDAVVQDVGTPRQTVLRGGHDQIEMFHCTPGPADVDQFGRRGLALDPATDRLVAHTCGNQQIRPGRSEWAGSPPIYADEARCTQQAGDEVPGAVDQFFCFIGRPQCPCQGMDLSVFTTPVAIDDPTGERIRHNVCAVMMSECQQERHSLAGLFSGK